MYFRCSSAHILWKVGEERARKVIREDFPLSLSFLRESFCQFPPQKKQTDEKFSLVVEPAIREDLGELEHDCRGGVGILEDGVAVSGVGAGVQLGAGIQLCGAAVSGVRIVEYFSFLHDMST